MFYNCSVSWSYFQDMDIVKHISQNATGQILHWCNFVPITDWYKLCIWPVCCVYQLWQDRSVESFLLLAKVLNNIMRAVKIKYGVTKDSDLGLWVSHQNPILHHATEASQRQRPCFALWPYGIILHFMQQKLRLDSGGSFPSDEGEGPKCPSQEADWIPVYESLEVREIWKPCKICKFALCGKGALAAVEERWWWWEVKWDIKEDEVQDKTEGKELWEVRALFSASQLEEINPVFAFFKAA